MFSARNTCFFVLLFLISSEIKGISYSTVDSVSRKISAPNPDALAIKINSQFFTEELRVRSVFVWMATHIAYDVEGFFQSGNLYARQWPAEEKDSLKRENIYTKQVAEKVFREKKGICAGYSRLFVYLMQKLGIESKGVIGWGKTDIKPVTTRYRSNHEWNMVKINGQWKLIDVTWAAGTTDFGGRKFTFDFSEHYFLTDPGLMLVDHFPENQQDALLSWVPSFGQFISRPMVYRDFWKLKPNGFSASSGYLKNTDSAIVLTFSCPVLIERIQFTTGASKAADIIYPGQNKTMYQGKNFVSNMQGRYRIRYCPQRRGGGKIIIYINGRAVMEFQQGNGN